MSTEDQVVGALREGEFALRDAMTRTFVFGGMQRCADMRAAIPLAEATAAVVRAAREVEQLWWFDEDDKGDWSVRFGEVMHGLRQGRLALDHPGRDGG